jgi:hypothetical protein
MAIRFQCSSCGQPIEVDDEWAAKSVACPYCRKTITAPAESTLGDVSQIPMATPLAMPGRLDSAPGASAPPYPTTMPLAHHPNPLALVAFGLSCFTLLLLFGAGAIASAHALEMESLQERVLELQQSGTPMMVATQQAMGEAYKESGGMPPRWMVLMGLMQMVALVTWVAALICGIIAVRRPRRRGWAVASLVTLGILPLMFCAGLLLGGTG